MYIYVMINKDIKTKEQFYNFADVWYQRTHKLIRVCQDENIDLVKREKACLLFNIMLKRVMKLTQVANKINQPLPRNH